MRAIFFAGPIDAIREFVDEAQARAIVFALRQGVTLSTRAVNYLTPTTVSELFLSTPLGWLVRWASPAYAEQLVSDHKRAALKNIADASALIDKLAGEWFRAAKTGIPASDGTATWSEWKRKAGIIADSLQAYAQYQSDASLIYNLPRLVADLAISTGRVVTDPGGVIDDVLDITPWWVYAGGAAIALGGAAYVFNTFAPRRR